MTKGQPRMSITFTCNVCDTENKNKSFGKRSYDKGIVIIRCEGCQNLHLIADRLGWLGHNTNVEELLEKKGETVLRIKEHLHKVVPVSESKEGEQLAPQQQPQQLLREIDVETEVDVPATVDVDDSGVVTVTPKID